MRVRFRSQSDRAAARRQRADGALQLAARARPGRHLRPAHRGHRLRALDARVRARHPRRPALDGARLGRGRRGRRRARPVSAVGAAAHLPGARRRADVDGRRRITASVRRSSSRPIARRRSQAGRPPKYVGRCRDIPPRRGAPARRERRAGGHPLPRARSSRDVAFDDIVRGEVRFSTDVIGDPVLVRSDGIPAYNFAVVVDDALMEITHVVRGEDHISNTPRQMLLYEAFGWTPPAFAHVSLVLGPDHSAAVEAARRDVGDGVPRARLPAGGADQLPGAASAGRRARARSCCRSTSWRGGSGSRTSVTAPACSTSRSWRG